MTISSFTLAPNTAIGLTQHLGISPRWRDNPKALERDVLGFGSESIGTDAGQAYHLRPPYPCHTFMHGAGRYGLQCLTNLDRLPATGAVVVAAPLKIRQGSGSPLRVIAFVSN